MSGYLSTPDIEASTAELKPTFHALTTAQQDIQSRRAEVAIDAAQEITPVTGHLFERDDEINLERLNELGGIGERELHRIRKVSEVYEGKFTMRLPTGALYRAALAAGKITTIGGIIIALKGIHDTASDIEATFLETPSGVTDEQIDAFYFASGIFIGELVLMATPVSANFAFQATGRLHSRLLWHRFHNPSYRSAYRLLLHHVYYFVRGLPSLALHSVQAITDRVTRLVQSVVFLVRTTWVAFDEPGVIADIRSVDLTGSLLDRIRTFSLDALRSELGAAVDELTEYVTEILEDLEDHYDRLYEDHLGGISKGELVTRIVREIVDDVRT